MIRDHQPQLTLGRPVLGLLLSCLSLGLASCTTSTKIDGTARDLIFATFRARADLPEKRLPRDAKPRAAAGFRFRGVWGLDFATQGSADDFTVQTPGYGAADFTAFEAQVAFRGGVELGEQVRIEGFGGLAYSYFELELTELGVGREKDVSNRFGPFVGMQTSWEALPGLNLYGRGSIAALLVDASSEQWELGLSYGLTDSLHLLFAHRWWKYEEEDIAFDTIADVDVELDLRGYVVGLILEF